MRANEYEDIDHWIRVVPGGNDPVVIRLLIGINYPEEYGLYFDPKNETPVDPP